MSLINWLKFFPYDHWAGPGPRKTDEISGPYFPKPRPNCWNVAGSKLYFMAPWSNPVFSFDSGIEWAERIQPGRGDITDTCHKKPSYQAVVRGWSGLFYQNTWFFLGPWYTGIRSRLIMSGTFVNLREESTAQGKNLLHPRIFELAVSEELDRIFGHSKTRRGTPRYRGPMNWQVIDIGPGIQAILCDVHEVGSLGINYPVITRELFIPVSERHLMRIEFDFFGKIERAYPVDFKPISDLCHSIIESIRFEPGDAFLEAWNKVKEDCPDMSLTKTMHEFNWPIEENGVDKAQEEREISTVETNLGIEKL